MKQRFKHSSVEDQMRVFNLTRDEAETKIRKYKEKLKNRRRGKNKRNPYDFKYQMERYNLSESEAKMKVQELKKKSASSHNMVNIHFWLNKGLLFCESYKKVKEYSEKYSTYTVEKIMARNGISRRGAEEFIKKTHEKQQKTYMKIKENDPFRWRAIRPWNKEHWIKKGYSESVAKKKAFDVAERNRKKYKVLLKKFPERYAASLNTKLEYWIKKTGGDIEKAKELYKERQNTFSLKQCILKHGETKGIEIFNARQEKWNKSLTANFLQYGDGRSPSSKFASDFIYQICEMLKIPIPQKEKFISDGVNAAAFDFTYNHKFIELNGDYWHFNPKIYDANYFDKRTQKFAHEKWKIDKEKIKLANKYNYDVLVIWESDFKNDPKKELEKALIFLK